MSLAAEPPAKPDEDESLRQEMAEAGSSSIDLARALERHLVKFPKSAHRAEIERALLRAYIENDDQKRVVEYGEKVLARDSVDLKTMDRVIRAMLVAGDQRHATLALDYAKRYQENIRDFEKEQGKTPSGEWRDEIDRGYSRALVLQARALDVLGRDPEALELARKAYDTFPSSDAPREIAHLLARSGKNEEAVRYYAEAFAIPDAHNREADRSADRARMGEIYRQLKGSEAGLGDAILEAYDRTTQLLRERELKLKQLDPNARLTNPMDFTITGLAGEKLALSSLKGKVLVLDFWATWCGPCRVQHGLYEQVKTRFKSRPEVVFLSINTDEDRELVPEFLTSNRWDKKVYYEDGLATALRISSIPTAILINKGGDIESRMNGFLPDRFVDQLSQRIQQALDR